MRIAPIVDVKAKLSTYVDDAATEGPIVITRNGRAVAVLIAPVDDEDLENLLLARSMRFQKLIERSRESVRAGKVMSSVEFWTAVSERTGDGPESEVSTEGSG